MAKIDCQGRSGASPKEARTCQSIRTDQTWRSAFRSEGGLASIITEVVEDH